MVYQKYLVDGDGTDRQTVFPRMMEKFYGESAVRDPLYRQHDGKKLQLYDLSGSAVEVCSDGLVIIISKTKIELETAKSGIEEKTNYKLKLQVSKR